MSQGSSEELHVFSSQCRRARRVEIPSKASLREPKSQKHLAVSLRFFIRTVAGALAGFAQGVERGGFHSLCFGGRRF